MSLITLPIAIWGARTSIWADRANAQGQHNSSDEARKFSWWTVTDSCNYLCVSSLARAFAYSWAIESMCERVWITIYLKHRQKCLTTANMHKSPFTRLKSFYRCFPFLPEHLDWEGIHFYSEYVTAHILLHKNIFNTNMLLSFFSKTELH